MMMIKDEPTGARAYASVYACPARVLPHMQSLSPALCLPERVFTPRLRLPGQGVVCPA